MSHTYKVVIFDLVPSNHAVVSTGSTKGVHARSKPEDDGVYLAGTARLSEWRRREESRH
jgi:dTDP-4-dehydrorhamnose 3,5-epimerase-like enzyme